MEIKQLIKLKKYYYDRNERLLIGNLKLIIQTERNIKRIIENYMVSFYLVCAGLVATKVRNPFVYWSQKVETHE